MHAASAFRHKSSFGNPEQVDCLYCKLKQKHNIGSEKDLKCLEHSFTSIPSPVLSFLQQPQAQLPERILELLEEAEDGLSVYWNNLNYYSKGAVENILRDISPIKRAMGSIEAVLSNFHFVGSSKKTQPSDEEEIVKSIQSWMYYVEGIIGEDAKHSKTTFDFPTSSLLTALPYQGRPELLLLKEQIFDKYRTVIHNHEEKLKRALGRMLYYIEICEGEACIERDLAFIQECTGGTAPTCLDSDGLLRALLVQAVSLEGALGDSYH